MLNNPMFAAKLIGKIDDIDVGYLMGYDENTPYIVPTKYGSESFSTDLKSFSNMLGKSSMETNRNLVIEENEIDSDFFTNN